MKKSHLKEEHIYLVSNHSVARNPMFASYELKQYFLKRVEKYLHPISEVLAYNLFENEFQLLVRLKKRKDFEHYYLGTHKSSKIEDVPESTHIFSRVMSNLQVSYVKHFNYIYGRTGSLVARRFDRLLIGNEKEMSFWIERLNKGEKKHSYPGIWVNELMNGSKAINSAWIYNGESKGERRVGGCLNAFKLDLASAFKKDPMTTLLSNKTPNSGYKTTISPPKLE